MHAGSNISLTEQPSCSWIITHGMGNTFLVLYLSMQSDGGLDRRLLQPRDSAEGQTGLPSEQSGLRRCWGAVCGAWAGVLPC